MWAMALQTGHETEADVSIDLKDSNEASYEHTDMLSARYLSGRESY